MLTYVGNYKTTGGVVHAVLQDKYGKNILPACGNNTIKFSPAGHLIGATKNSHNHITCQKCCDALTGKEISVRYGSAIVRFLNKHIRKYRDIVSKLYLNIGDLRSKCARIEARNEDLEEGIRLKDRLINKLEHDLTESLTKIAVLKAELKTAKDKLSTTCVKPLEYEITPVPSESAPIGDASKYFIIKPPNPHYYSDGTLHPVLVILDSEEALIRMIEHMAEDGEHIQSLTFVRGKELKILTQTTELVSYSLSEA